MSLTQMHKLMIVNIVKITCRERERERERERLIEGETISYNCRYKFKFYYFPTSAMFNDINQKGKYHAKNV